MKMLFGHMLGLYSRCEGLMGFFSCRWFRVVYPDGLKSMRMPLGNAREYRSIFGGKVEWAGEQWPENTGYIEKAEEKLALFLWSGR